MELQIESTIYVLKTAVVSFSLHCHLIAFHFLLCSSHFLSLSSHFLSFSSHFHLVSFQVSFAFIFISFPSIFISLICCKFVVYTANCTVFVSMKAFNGNCARVLQLESTICALKTVVLSFSLHCQSRCLSFPFIFIWFPFIVISFPFMFILFPFETFRNHLY